MQELTLQLGPMQAGSSASDDSNQSSQWKANSLTALATSPPHSGTGSEPDSSKIVVGVCEASLQSPMVSCGAGYFKCPKCLKTLPLSEGVPKGQSVWCSTDNSSYSALQGRWSKNKDLRTWWQSLSAEEQTQWFLRWQSMLSKRRFDGINFAETSSRSAGVRDEDVDAFIPWDKFLRDGMAMGKSSSVLEGEWKDIIQNRRAECRFHRGQWLVPRYEGMERRQFQQQDQSWHLSRHAAIQDEAQLNELQTGANEIIQRFSDALRAAVLPTPQLPAPHVESSEAEQSRFIMPADLIHGNVMREAMF